MKKNIFIILFISFFSLYSNSLIDFNYHLQAFLSEDTDDFKIKLLIALNKNYKGDYYLFYSFKKIDTNKDYKSYKEIKKIKVDSLIYKPKKNGSYYFGLALKINNKFIIVDRTNNYPIKVKIKPKKIMKEVINKKTKNKEFLDTPMYNLISQEILSDIINLAKKESKDNEILKKVLKNKKEYKELKLIIISNDNDIYKEIIDNLKNRKYIQTRIIIENIIFNNKNQDKIMHFYLAQTYYFLKLYSLAYKEFLFIEGIKETKIFKNDIITRRNYEFK